MKLNNQGLIAADVIVAVAILNIVAVFVVLGILRAVGEIKVAETKAQLSEIHKAVWLLSNDTGQLPGHLPAESRQFLSRNIWDLNSKKAGLTVNDSPQKYPNWQGPYISAIPKDPWGNDYFFTSRYLVAVGNGQWEWAVVVGSFGPNGTSQNIDPNDQDDIIRVVR